MIRSATEPSGVFEHRNSGRPGPGGPPSHSGGTANEMPIGSINTRPSWSRAVSVAAALAVPSPNPRSNASTSVPAAVGSEQANAQASGASPHAQKAGNHGELDAGSSPAIGCWATAGDEESPRVPPADDPRVPPARTRQARRCHGPNASLGVAAPPLYRQGAECRPDEGPAASADRHAQ